MLVAIATATASEGLWSDDEIESLIVTAVAGFAAIAFLYWFVLKPVLGAKDEAGRDDEMVGEGAVGADAGGRTPTVGGTRTGGVAGGARMRGPAAGGGGMARNAAAHPAADRDGGSGGGISSTMARSSRRPPHLSPSAAGGMAASSLLSEGVLPFRHTSASGYESRLSEAKVSDEDVVKSNRLDRARLFTRLFSPAVTGTTGVMPPSRGGNVVVSVQSEDAGCPRLARALFLLGTYYNLFVVLGLPPPKEGDSTGSEKEDDEMIQSLRKALRGGGNGGGGGEEVLPKEVLPDHRIVACRSVTGLVAFVRQLHRPEFVLDHDEEVRAQLGRFGFTVLKYDAGAGSNAGSGISNLGRMLLPS